ncbi:sulfate adenylyltransferase subunit CysD [Gallaecimonas sp. GXIMD4217]|uniref:sulfate adenylyltransferase subunit CysD n=1 Tax=Gallaecimonas sp. GXIMD4217 TaxID=3131927 RepID=UPI00311ABACC
MTLSPHLQALEAQAIHIIRETAAEFERPVMLYSIGKDSSVLLHLVRKAFLPGPVPFPVLHIDTGWKFQAMYAFRDAQARKFGLELKVVQHPDRLSPFEHGSRYTDVMKTEALKGELARGRYDAAFGGARRDEEASRAKERVFSHRDAHQRWEPRRQRPELWSHVNSALAADESMRVFPLSNFTEQDIWAYIQAENIELVPLYFAAERPVVRRDGQLFMVDDERFELRPGEVIERRKVRFRTLGCYPLTAAIESEADSLEAVLEELGHLGASERSGRLIDKDQAAAMERKKRQGYF